MAKRHLNTFRIIVGGLLVTIPLLLFILIRYIRQGTPMMEINEARKNIAEAKRVQASIYSRELYGKAVLFYDSAMNQWKRENEKIFFNRDFETVRIHAVQANRFALQAIDQSGKNHKSREKTLDDWISVLNKRLSGFEGRFGNFPMTAYERNSLAKCKLLLGESIFALKSSNFEAAELNLESASLLIEELEEDFNNTLKDYLSQYPLWTDWYVQTIDHSVKNRTTCVIIDKLDRTCLLYKNGILQKKYVIELGRNWIGDKQYLGDKRTPEGQYRVVARKSGGETRYYRAMLINYPNEEDKKRFSFNKKNGIIPKTAEIGGLIEIHGRGGKGSDWTDGCIALKDDDMKELYDRCGINTRVTIVGSVRPLNEILENND